MFGPFPRWKIQEKRGAVRRIMMNEPNVHHDTLKFPNGETVLLSRLHQGQLATVVQISATPRTVNKRKSEPSSAEPPPILMATVSLAKRRATSPLCGMAMARVPALAARLSPTLWSPARQEAIIMRQYNRHPDRCLEHDGPDCFGLVVSHAREATHADARPD